MNEELYSRLRELSSGRLLVILAFLMDQYTLEAQTVLRRLGAERGLSDEDVQRLRQRTLVGKFVQYRCRNCHELLDLDEYDLRDGIFTCPVCDRLQLVNYGSIARGVDNPDTDEGAEPGLASILGEWEDDNDDPPHESPYGIGGWLAVLIGLLDIDLLASLVMFPDALAGTTMTALIAIICNIVVVAGLVIAKQFRLRIFPHLCIGYLGAASVVVAAYGASSPQWPGDYIRTAAVFVIAGVWTTYLIRSRRVRATFTRTLR